MWTTCTPPTPSVQSAAPSGPSVRITFPTPSYGQRKAWNMSLGEPRSWRAEEMWQKGSCISADSTQRRAQQFLHSPI